VPDIAAEGEKSAARGGIGQCWLMEMDRLEAICGGGSSGSQSFIGRCNDEQPVVEIERFFAVVWHKQALFDVSCPFRRGG